MCGAAGCVHLAFKVEGEVYPHVCGAARIVPLVIGVYDRSIPTCAGQPLNARVLTSRDGLSPRVRGSQRPTVTVSVCPGSIPTCAGQPARRKRAGMGFWVYPHVCGAAVFIPVTSI